MIEYMFSSNTFLTLAQSAPPPADSPSLIGGLLPMILLIAGFWFLIIQPQRKKQKQHEKMVSELKSGDSVVTAGGIYGKITNVKNDRFVLKVSDNAKVEITKSSVSQRLEEKESEEESS